MHAFKVFMIVNLFGVSAASPNSTSSNSSSVCRYSGNVHLEVSCTELEGIGHLVDNMIKSYTQFDDVKILLELDGVAVPNGTLRSGWYTGKRRIDFLYLSYVAIDSIEYDAFQAKAFRQLQEIQLHSVHNPCEYHDLLFDGLSALSSLILGGEGEPCDNLPAKFLMPVSKTLSIFTYRGRTTTPSVLTNLFGMHKLSKLAVVNFECDHDHFISLHAANFSGLTVIRNLLLDHCRVQTIADNTFDFIADTLLHLLFGNSDLKVLSLDVFRRYLDRWPLQAGRQSEHPYFVLSHQECSADFYRLRNATVISYGPRQYELIKCSNDTPIDGDGIDQQFVHPLRWHLNHEDVTLYAFPKVVMHLMPDEQSLRVRRNHSDFIRVFIWAIEWPSPKNHCPRNEEDAVRCWRLNRSEVTLPLIEIGESPRIVAAAVIQISFRKQALPVQFISTRIRIEDQGFDVVEMKQGLLLAIVCGFLLSASIALCVVIIGRCVRQKKEPVRGESLRNKRSSYESIHFPLDT